LLLLGALLASALWIDYLQVAESIGLAEEQLTGAESSSPREGGARTRVDAQKIEQEMKSAREVLVLLNQPWDKLFQAIESVERRHVALLSVEPDPAKRRIKLTAEAKDLNAMLDYAGKLGKQGVLSRVLLQSHQIQQRDAQKPVRFELTANWEVQQ